MQSILSVTTPFFALVLLGWAVARARLFALDAIPGLNAFVLLFALPCMLFRFSAITPIAQLLDPAAVAVYLTSAIVLVALAVLAARRRAVSWEDASFGALCAAFPNSGFMGVPLVIGLMGSAAAAPAIVALALDMVLTTSLCIGLSQSGHRLGADVARTTSGTSGRAIFGILTNPLPWAIALGMLFSAIGASPPKPLMAAVDMLAAAASPAALFALGCMLARSQMTVSPRGTARGVPIIVACKLVLHPLLVLAVGRLAIAIGITLDPFYALVLVLVAALPSASNVPMLAERFGADGGRLARIVFFSTVGAFVTFTAVAAWVTASEPMLTAR